MAANPDGFMIAYLEYLLNIVFYNQSVLNNNIVAGASVTIDRISDLINDLEIDTDFIAEAILGATEDDLARLTGNVEDDIALLLGRTTSELVSSQSQAIQGIENKSSSAIDMITGFAGNLFGRLDNDLGDALRTVTGLFGDTNGLIQDLLTGNATMIEVLTQRAASALEDIVREHSEVLGTVFGEIGESIVPLLEDSAANNERVSNKVIEALDETIAQSQNNAEQAENNLADAIEAITGESQSALSTTKDALIESGEAQTVATAEGATEVSGAISESVGKLDRSLSNFSDSFTEEGALSTQEGIKAAITKSIKLSNCPPEFREIIDGFIDELLGTFSVMGATAQIMLIPELAKAVITPIIMVLGNCLNQAAARLAPTSLASPSELVDQYRRGIVNDETAIQDMLSQGYSLDRAANYLAQSEEKPEVGLVQTWYLRGFIDTDSAVRALAQLGYSNESIEYILRMSYFIPPVQDLITMAVREVFTPDIAARFGQFDDYPAEFTGYAGQQGISEYWARNYWAAHWALPSPQQGFEMLQRRIPGTQQKIIEREDLDLLLRALDIMPFWREKLTNIAYRPITRVDIRRMADLGLISYDEVQLRYEDIGFAPPDAALMTEFTRAYNKDGEVASVDELEGLTRSMVVRLYKQGAFSRQQAEQALIELGHSANASTIILESAAIDLEVDDREAKTGLILEQAKAGAITFGQAFDRLGSLGLEPVELERAQIKLEREQARQTKLPSLAQITQMYKADIVSSAEFLITAERLGYSLYWGQKFLDLAKG